MSREGNPPLDAKSIEILFRFAIITDGSGGIKLAFPPFEASLEAKLTDENIQEMKVVFE